MNSKHYFKNNNSKSHTEINRQQHNNPPLGYRGKNFDQNRFIYILNLVANSTARHGYMVVEVLFIMF